MHIALDIYIKVSGGGEGVLCMCPIFCEVISLALSRIIRLKVQ